MDGPKSHSKHSGSSCSQLACWPVVIYVIFAVIILIGILLSTQVNSNTKAWSFFIVLLWSLVWVAILWFLCRSGQHAFSWFLLLLPLAVGIFWYISVFLASATTASHCVSTPAKM